MRQRDASGENNPLHAPPRRADQRILSATLGDPIRIPDSFGDLWSCTLAADGTVFTVADDTTGFGNSCESNLALHRLDGTPPDLVGLTVNAMEEFGRFTAIELEDGTHWKAISVAAIDGALYMTVARMRYMQYPAWLQESHDASIIRSDDGGATWTPAPRVGEATFRGRSFSTPFFIEHGADGGGGFDEYVYAVSNDGVWADGLGMKIGRVRRDRIARLDPSDWEFFHGFGPYQQLVEAHLEAEAPVGDPLWSPRADDARYMFSSPGQTSMTGVHYIPGLDTYVMPQWHHPLLHIETFPARWQTTQLRFYEASRPWGPWSLFHVADSHPEGFYNPTLPLPWLSEDGTRGWLLASGDFTPPDHPYYALWTIPIEFELAT
jgi:hypothetical protein